MEDRYSLGEVCNESTAKEKCLASRSRLKNLVHYLKNVNIKEKEVAVIISKAKVMFSVAFVCLSATC